MIGISTVLMSIDNPSAIRTAVGILSRGGLVVFPTDTVYGVGCRVDDAAAIDKIYAVKERAPQKAIAVLIAESDQLGLVARELNPAAKKLADKFWPGALTLVVNKQQTLPGNLTPFKTVGVRIPNHDFARRLLKVSGPLATSSANISGGKNTQTAQEVMDQLNGKVDLILDGGTVNGGVPSTVVDCTVNPPDVLRAGAIPAEAIRKALL